MSTTTTNYGLHKIDLTDAPPDITVLNDNWDAIDSELNNLKHEQTSCTGTGEAYEVSVSGIESLTAGVSFIFTPNVVSSKASPTINVNGLGAKNIRRRISGSTSTTVATGGAGGSTNWLSANKPVRLTYDGDYWIADIPKPNMTDGYGILPIENGGTGATSLSSINLSSFNDDVLDGKYLPLSGGLLTGNLIIPNGTSILLKNNSGNAVSSLIIDSSNNLILGNGTGTIVNTSVKGKTVELKSESGQISLAPSGTAYKFIAKSISGSSVGPAFYCSTKNYGTLGTANFLWNRVYAVNGVSTSSDERLKENISDDFSKLAEVFMKLRPVTFEYSDIKDGKTRIGFIAQDIEKAMKDEDLDPDKFSFLQKDELNPDSEMAKNIGDTTVYSLNYSEFIALNTAMIQKQQSEIDEMKKEIEGLKLLIKEK